MVQVIGEIGGSSSRWAVLAPDGSTGIWPVKGERWPGFNPLSGDGEGFATELLALFGAAAPDALNAGSVAIHGAGCGTPDRRDRMAHAITRVWPRAKVQVGTDLEGAALGLCGSEPGLVLILGTGMNAGYSDGTRLHLPMPSLGYLLGDEGSGADIGRHVLQDAFHHRIPEELHLRIFGQDGPVLSEVLARVHGASHPARELAAFTALLAPHLEEPYARELIQGRFQALVDLLVRYFMPEQRVQVFATGSVAYGFRTLLAATLQDHGMALTVVEPDPLQGLVRYHRQRGSA
jgi:N-acetylglucosamine kinase-like BadF-type ATPase